jgi:4-amino-4-deoxy-L-arabinose transferase-like glycosyltransferase
LSALVGHCVAAGDRVFAKLTDPRCREWMVILVLVAYVAVWTVYGVLAKGSQDVHADMAEAVAWSRELALGYSKHPPLSAWMVAAWFAIFPVTDWAFYLLAMTTVGIALWTAWRLAGDYLDPKKQVMALAMLMLIPFFNFHALKFNANTVLVPLWAATTLCFLRSYERRSAGWAALAGLFAAGAMLGKYWSIFLIVGLGIAALLDSRRAAYFRSPAPWITIAVGAVALTPHIVWLVASDFEPFKSAVMVHARAESAAWSNVLHYLTGSLAYVIVSMIVVGAAMRPSAAAFRDMLLPKEPARQLAARAFWLPFLLPLAAPFMANVNIPALWSMSAWTLLPVVVLSSPLCVLRRNAAYGVVTVTILLPLIMVAAAPAIAIAVFHDPDSNGSFHSRLLADRITYEWGRVTDQPLRMVAGDDDLPYGAAFYLPSRPTSYAHLSSHATLWGVDRERLRRQGFVLVCRTSSQCPVQAAQHGYRGTPIDVKVTPSFGGFTRRIADYIIVIVPPGM